MSSNPATLKELIQEQQHQYSECDAHQIDFLLLVANKAEVDAVCSMFNLRYFSTGVPVAYKWGNFKGKYSARSLKIAVIWLEDDYGAVRSYSYSRTAIELLHPSYFFILGTAAGASTPEERVLEGDVACATFIRHGPEGKRNSLREAAIQHPSPRLLQLARKTYDKKEWLTKINPSKYPEGEVGRLPSCLFGEVASTNKMCDPMSDYVVKTISSYRKVIAFEMEAGGIATFLRELADVEFIPGLLFIKSISDIVYSDGMKQRVDNLNGANKDELLENLQKENNDQRNKWKHYASHVSTAFVYQIINDFPKELLRPANPDLFWPPTNRLSVYTNTGCIGVYAGVEPDAYSKLAADLLSQVALDHHDSGHFFSVCSYSPRELWEAIVRATEFKGDKTPTTTEEVFRSAEKYFPHFPIFIKHNMEHPRTGTRILLLDDFNDWLPKHKMDASNPHKTLRQHWELFLLLNGCVNNNIESGIPCFGIDRKYLKSRSSGDYRFRFLTDYVLLGGHYLLDYYDESGTLIASELCGKSQELYYYDLFKLLEENLGNVTGSPFKPLKTLNQEAVESFSKMEA